MRALKHILWLIKMYSTYNTGRPAQFDGSNTFCKLGIPSVGMAPMEQTYWETVITSN